MKFDNITCGLDFGTSNSVITLTDNISKKKVFTFSDSSILYFPETNEMEYYVGKKAQLKYLEEEMNGRLLKSAKSLLPQDKFLFTWICGKRLTPDQLVTCIVKYLKSKAEDFLGHEITDVVMGRPAIFSEDTIKEDTAVQRLVLGAKNAGFKNIKLQLEPIAAAFSYEMNLKQNENVLVADFGGGTSDFTIMNLSPDKIHKLDRKSDVIAYGGVYVGGDLFDSEIMWHKLSPHFGRGVKYKSYNKELEIPTALHWELRNWERSFMLKESKLRRAMDGYYVFSDNNPQIDNLRVLIDNNYIYSLFTEIEKAKIDLSSMSETAIKFEKQSINIYEPFHLQDFENIIRKHINTIEQYVLDLIEAANLSSKDIDSVFITGGSSLVVPIRNILYSIFGKEKIRSQDTFNSVAYGLSLCS